MALKLLSLTSEYRLEGTTNINACKVGLLSILTGYGSSTSASIGVDIEIKGGSASGAEDSDIDSDGGHMREISEIEEESKRGGEEGERSSFL